MTLDRWELWLEIMRLVIVPITGYLAYLLRGILIELHDLNSRIIRLEQWQIDHTRDEERRVTRLEAYILKYPVT